MNFQEKTDSSLVVPSIKTPVLVQVVAVAANDEPHPPSGGDSFMCLEWQRSASRGGSCR